MTNNESTADGVIRYQLHFTPAPAPVSGDTAMLRAWFIICRRTGLVGQSPDRYQGAAYGNLSQRQEGNSFLVTGSQTSGLEQLETSHFCLVKEFSVTRNMLVAEGPSNPSSEAMTHGMVYRQLPAINAVVHVHSPVIWNNSDHLQLPVTHPDAEYGTPEMTREVERLLRNSPSTRLGIFSMGGHEDGIVAYGETLHAAGTLLLETLARALALELADKP